MTWLVLSVLCVTPVTRVLSFADSTDGGFKGCVGVQGGGGVDFLHSFWDCALCIYSPFVPTLFAFCANCKGVVVSTCTLVGSGCGLCIYIRLSCHLYLLCVPIVFAFHEIINVCFVSASLPSCKHINWTTERANEWTIDQVNHKVNEPQIDWTPRANEKHIKYATD